MIPGYLSAPANHLWQSTLVALAAGGLTMALRKNRASVRYWVWLAASVKFLVPFSLLVSLGSELGWRTAPAVAPVPFASVMDEIGRPFAPPAKPPALAEAPAVSANVPVVLPGVWFGGFFLVALSWAIQWRRIRTAVRSASAMEVDFPIKVLSSRAGLEPGVFGILRPVLVVPHGILKHLTRAQWEAILAHEWCLDFRRRLLLAAAGFVAVGGPVVFGFANSAQDSVSLEATAGSPVAFEVASVKPSDPRGGDAGSLKGGGRRTRGAGFQVGPRRFTAARVNLFGLIAKAYGLRACRPLGGGNCALLSGGPDWLRKPRFDIQAKMPDDSPSYTSIQFQNGQAPQLQLMLQALLADRFQLRVHREKQEVPVYALTVAKRGPKLAKADAGEEHKLFFRPSLQPDGEGTIQLVARSSSLQEVAELYSQFMDRPVLDRTGLEGRFDLRWNMRRMQMRRVLSAGRRVRACSGRSRSKRA
jgi:uncharacterized protein (TIGR03435 family)